MSDERDMSVSPADDTSAVYGGSNYEYAEHECVLSVLARAEEDGSLESASLTDLSNAVVDTFRDLVRQVNAKRENGGREMGWPMPKSISAPAAAELVFRKERIRMVCTKENVRKPTADGVIAAYVTDGPDRGIYREIGPGQVDSWCEELAGSVNAHWKGDFVQKIHDMASRDEFRVAECSDSDFVFMQNGVYDYRSGVLMDFDPELVTLRKHATVLPEDPPAEPVHTKPDGTKITFWEWIDSLVPYEGGRDLLVKLAGAALRDRYNWRVMATLFNKTGHNGKSTYLDCLKAMVGSNGVMSSNLATLAGSSDGGRFGVSNIVGVSLITCEDSDSGAYIRDNSRLKSIISHDTISVERKGETMFDYTPHALIVAAANDLPKTKDKGQAWLDRNIYVPFTGEFRGKDDDKTIRERWVVSPEFCSYMAYQALVVWDKYWALPEPEEAIRLKDEFILDNDPIAEFWQLVMSGTATDFFPNDWLWEQFTQWLRADRPSTRMPSKKAFVVHITELAVESGEWVRPSSGSRGLPLSVAKWSPTLATNAVYASTRRRGLVRREVWDWCSTHKTTPGDMGQDGYEKLRENLQLPRLESHDSDDVDYPTKE